MSNSEFQYDPFSTRSLGQQLEDWKLRQLQNPKQENRKEFPFENLLKPFRSFEKDSFEKLKPKSSGRALDRQADAKSRLLTLRSSGKISEEGYERLMDLIRDATIFDNPGFSFELILQTETNIDYPRAFIELNSSKSGFQPRDPFREERQKEREELKKILPEPFFKAGFTPTDSIELRQRREREETRKIPLLENDDPFQIRYGFTPRDEIRKNSLGEIGPFQKPISSMPENFNLGYNPRDEQDGQF